MVRVEFFYLDNKLISRAYYFRLKKSGRYVDHHYYSGGEIVHHLCSAGVFPIFFAK